MPFAAEERGRSAIEDPLVFVNDPTALLLSRRFAVRHGLGTGSQIRLLTAEGPRNFRVRGLLEDTGAAASFGGQVAVMFLDAAQVAFARGTSVDRIDVALAPGADVEHVRRRLQRLVGSGLNVERPDRLGVRLRALAEPLRAALFISGVLALLVGAFLVYNAVGVAVAQRRVEIGLLRALGVTRREVTWLFCAEAFVLALPAVALGLLLGRSLAQYSTAQTLGTLDKLYVAVAQVEVGLDPRLALEAAAAGLITAVLAAFLPAWRGATIDPAHALRASAIRAARLPILPMLAASAALSLLAWLATLPGTQLGAALCVTLVVLGAALAIPALVMLLRGLLRRPLGARLGVPARLGLDYVQRTLGRSSVNVLALMVAVSMSVSVAGFLSAFERSIARWAEQVGTADLTVTQGSPVLDRRHVPLRAAAAEQIARVAGVADVQRFRMVDRQVAGISLRFVATDVDTFLRESARRGGGWEVLQGELPRIGQLAARPGILLSENAARHLRLSAGDTLTLPTPRGDIALHVQAVIVDYTAESGRGLDRGRGRVPGVLRRGRRRRARPRRVPDLFEHAADGGDRRRAEK